MSVNKAHSIWTLLPDGYADRERTTFKLSLVVSLRAITVNGALGDMIELADWPTQLANLDTVSVLVEGQTGATQARITSRRPTTALWQALFAQGTPVQLDGGGDLDDFDDVTSAVSYRPLVSALRAVYADGGELDRVLSGLGQWSLLPSADARTTTAVVPSAPAAVRTQVADLLDPRTMTAASVDRAAALLREHGLPDAAAAAPLVGVVRRLRSAAGSVVDPNSPPTIPDEPSGDPYPPGRFDDVRTVDQADFHQLLGLVSAHPPLALALGLRLDLEMPAFVGTKAIRVTGGLPLLIANGAPWSKVVADPGNGRFTMATQPNAPTEITSGMLDLRADGPGAERHVLTTMDVVGATVQLAALAARGTAGSAAAPVNPPPRRNVGITLAQADRRAGVVSHTIERGRQISAVFGEPEGFDPDREPERVPDTAAAPGPGEVVLFADDVTAGYRVDVRDGDGPWRSLMHRRTSYRIGSDTKNPAFALTVDDEGFVDPMTAVEQRDAEGNPVLEIGESLFTWDGWGLTVPRPGPSVGSRPDGGVGTVAPSNQGSDRYPLRIDVATRDGSLPRLRYGRTYRFRIRAVDLAGNSIEPALCPPELVSVPVGYRRLDPLPAPELVLRYPLTAGESTDRVVVRSDGDGTMLGGTERHLTAARAWQQLAELHGLFDAAIGPDSPERTAARQRLLTVGAIEAGAFTDTMVPDPADPTRKIPAPGIRVAVNADAPNPPTGSLAGLVRGEPLPPGEYVVHDTDTLHLPYLPDPLAFGVALAGLPTSDGEPVTVKYGGGTWPGVQPIRLIAQPWSSPGVKVTAGTAAGRPTLTVAVPPAAELVTSLSSTLTPAGLAVMEQDLPVHAHKGALAGQEPTLTPAREVRLVHAVRRPLLPLAMKSAVADPNRPVGSTVVDITGAVQCHPASTARIDIEATWFEPVDDGVSSVRTESRTAIVGSVTVLPHEQNVQWQVRQSLGDGKRRDITYRAIATTRFREYFPLDTPTAQLMRRTDAGVQSTAINTTRPDPVDVHSVIPTFRWQRWEENDVRTSIRTTAGVRVWLRRPWVQTGTGELLGVVVYRNGNSVAWARDASTSSLHSQMTRWNADPLDGGGAATGGLHAANFPARAVTDQSMPTAYVIPDGEVDEYYPVDRDVLGHTVRYDPERKLWYADVDIDIPASDQQLHFPFVRLALVRHQPKSAPGCRFSPIVVTEPIQLPPKRTLTLGPSPTGNNLILKLTGPKFNNSDFQVDLIRQPPPYDDPSAIGEADADGGYRIELDAEVVGDQVVATATLPSRLDGVTGTSVVRELQRGDSLHDITKTPGRTIYLEIL